MRFRQFISLGVHCFTAASMSKYGLRGSSGPFDWLITADFRWVLRYMETDFCEFLDLRNLKRWNNASDQFTDTQSGFVFLHDREYPFEEQHGALKRKYEKKISRFLSDIENPTCFIRICSGETEVAYIIEAAEYVNHVIKRKNENNEIVFLITNNVVVPQTMPFRYYKISPQAISNPAHECLRSAFDEAGGLLRYCAKHYDAVSMMDNLIFDRNKEAEHLRRMEWDQKRYDTLRRLVNTDLTQADLASSIIIYGAGAIGSFFYEKIRGKCRVSCFVDQEKRGSIDGIPIKRIEEICFDEKPVFVVTATYDYKNIYDRIRGCCNEAAVMSLDDLIAGKKE